MMAGLDTYRLQPRASRAIKFHYLKSCVPVDKTKKDGLFSPMFSLSVYGVNRDKRLEANIEETSPERLAFVQYVLTASTVKSGPLSSDARLRHRLLALMNFISNHVKICILPGQYKDHEYAWLRVKPSLWNISLLAA